MHFSLLLWGVYIAHVCAVPWVVVLLPWMDPGRLKKKTQSCGCLTWLEVWAGRERGKCFRKIRERVEMVILTFRVLFCVLLFVCLVVVENPSSTCIAKFPDGITVDLTKTESYFFFILLFISLEFIRRLSVWWLVVCYSSLKRMMMMLDEAPTTSPLFVTAPFISLMELFVTHNSNE